MTSAKMAQGGNYREAQAYAKVFNRKMRKAVVSPSNQQVKADFLNNFAELYEDIGAQDEQDYGG